MVPAPSMRKALFRLCFVDGALWGFPCVMLADTKVCYAGAGLGP